MYHQIEIIALIKLALSQLIKKVFQVSKMDLILNSEQKINKMELSSKSKTKLEELKENNKMSNMDGFVLVYLGFALFCVEFLQKYELVLFGIF